MSTPLRRQYLDIKRRYPHAILFFRLGDFYETFDEDAETVARELEITLTSRPVGKDQRVPLAGIPHHALDSYLGKLIARGYKVAICEQTEEPGRGKKIVDRQVVRVVTPGTLVEDKLLQGAANNYLAALVAGPGATLAGLAYADISTGEFSCLQAEVETLKAELHRLAPAELLLTRDSTAPEGLTATITPLADFDERLAVTGLLAHLGAATLDFLGLNAMPLAAAAAGAVVHYLGENQPHALGHVVRLSSERAGAHMMLDGNTLRNLELFESLAHGPARSQESAPLTFLGVIDHTRTPMGTRLLRHWVGQPLLDISQIQQRQDCVQFFFDSAVRRGQSQAALKNIPDMERIAARISTAAAGSPASTTPRDLAGLRRGLDALPALREVIEAGGGGSAAADLADGLHPCAETSELIRSAIEDDPQGDRVIRAGFSDELDTLRATARDARQVLAGIEQRERERTGIKSLKIGYNRVFGYYIEVSKANAGLVPDDYQRKQTLVGGERYTTPELQEHEYRVLHAQERLEELEVQLLRRVCAQVAAAIPCILETAGAVARVDAFCSLGEAAARYGYARPEVDESDVIEVKDGRHPVVERMLPDGVFVPN
ncbi:MAG TPA: DNA mismatch repair protein MutS, partial [Dehalococcoidia bacterium]|nr:DNA mismatch repair protein MutS [Dehalococcoidia bacterium]